MNTPADTLMSLLPSSLAGALGSTFGQMAIAEEEIESIRAEYPERSGYLNKVGFLLCMPSPILREASDWTFRAHCREILERAATDQDTRPATSAELAIAFSETSLKAPLNPRGAGLYARHFLRITALVGKTLHPELAESLRQIESRLEPVLAEPLELDAHRSLRQKERKPKMTLKQFERRAAS
jgi:hypothetical protein